MKVVSCIALGLVTAAMLTAQTGNRKVTQNPKSPPADTTATIGGTKITIEYNAPSIRSREIGKTVDPYNGKIWRFGADSATTMTTTGDITIGTLTVPTGVHTLYVMAGSNGWELVVNKQTGQWGTQYDEKQDLGRVPMKTTAMSPPAETLKITVRSSGGANGQLEADWGNVKATVPIKAK